MFKRLISYLYFKFVSTKQTLQIEEQKINIETFELFNKIKLHEKNIDQDFCHPKVILEVAELLFSRFSKQEQLQILTDYIAQIWISDSNPANDEAFIKVVSQIVEKRRNS